MKTKILSHPQKRSTIHLTISLHLYLSFFYSHFEIIKNTLERAIVFIKKSQCQLKSVFRFRLLCSPNNCFLIYFSPLLYFSIQINLFYNTISQTEWKSYAQPFLQRNHGTICHKFTECLCFIQLQISSNKPAEYNLRALLFVKRQQLFNKQPLFHFKALAYIISIFFHALCSFFWIHFEIIKDALERAIVFL